MVACDICHQTLLLIRKHHCLFYHIAGDPIYIRDNMITSMAKIWACPSCSDHHEGYFKER